MRIASDIGGTLICTDRTNLAGRQFVRKDLLQALIELHHAGHEVYFLSGMASFKQTEMLHAAAAEMGLLDRLPEGFFKVSPKKYGAGAKFFDLVLDDEDVNWSNYRFHLDPNGPEAQDFIRNILKCGDKGLEELLAALFPREGSSAHPAPKI